MTEPEEQWLDGGRGLGPEWTWSFTADAPLVGLDLARETGETLVADTAGSVYLLDRRGRVVTLSRGLHALDEIAWSDAGELGAVVVDDHVLHVLSRQLRITWSYEFQQAILAIAVDPFGRHFACCLAGGETRILNASRKTVSRFETSRPLAFIRFVATETDLIAAAESGQIFRIELDGTPLWRESCWSNIGDLAITGDARTVLIAGLNLGIQRFDGDGNSQGTYVIEGTPNRVAVSFALRRLITSTVENSVYWLDSEGEILWAADVPESIRTLRCDPFGTGIVCGFESGRVVRLDWGMPIT